jgi:hypothetical protein
VFLTLLEMIQRQCDGFVSSQPTREQESQQSAVSLSFQPLAIRRLPKRLPLLCRQPVAKATTNTCCQVGTQQAAIGCLIRKTAYGTQS